MSAEFCVPCAQLSFSQLYCIAVPQHVFLAKRKNKTGLSVAPRGQSRATEGSSSQEHNAFVGPLLADCVSCDQWLAWLDYAFSS